MGRTLNNDTICTMGGSFSCKKTKVSKQKETQIVIVKTEVFAVAVEDR